MTQLRELTVPLVDWGVAPAIERVDSLFEVDYFETHAIDQVNWPQQFPAKPEAVFKIAYSEEEIYIKFYVHESQIRATFIADNGRPWQDSCVEFFVAPDPDSPDIYYNFEMNCIGYGILHARTPSEPLVMLEDAIGRIRRLPSLPRKAFGIMEGDFHWTLTVAIPVEVFSLSRVPTLPGRALRANFYKCGDRLPTPHYLSWSPIENSLPTFHQPKFFGTMFLAR